MKLKIMFGILILAFTAVAGEMAWAELPPAAQETASTLTPAVGEIVTFDASLSTYSPGYPIISYVWNFGDGTTGTGVTVTHSYAAAGGYFASLVVTAASGLTGSVALYIVVSAPPPPFPPSAIENVSTLTPEVGTAVTFDGSQSSGPTGFPITSYFWDFGDGTTSTAAIVTHVYTAPGGYSAVLTVTDGLASSALSSLASELITVTPVNAPTNLSLASSSPSDLNFNWTAGGTDAAGYTVSLVNGTSNTQTCASGQDIGNVISFDFTSLSASTAYTAQVCAYNSAGYYSSGVTLTENTQAGTPPAPTGFAVIGSTANSATLGWTSGGGSTTGFWLAAAAGSTAPSCTVGTNVGNVTTGTVSSLSPGTLYSFSLCAYNSVGGIGAQVATSGTTQTAATKIALVSTTNPAYVTQPVTFIASVTSAAGTPTGSVSFLQGATVLGTAPLVNGQAGYTTSFATAGTHAITASYSGNSGYLCSVAPALSETVKRLPAATTTNITSSGSPFFIGQPVTITASVSSTFGTIPNGETIAFRDGAERVIGTAPLVGGAASLTISTLTVGSHSIRAVYPSDGTFAASTSTAISQVVGKYGTATVLQSSPNPSIYRQSVTLTAGVTSTGSSAPTGTVVFRNGSTTIGSASLVSGVATLTIKNLPVGTDSLTAAYKGDAASAASTSVVLNQVVGPY